MKLGIADSKEILTVVQDGKKKEYELIPVIIGKPLDGRLFFELKPKKQEKLNMKGWLRKCQSPGIVRIVLQSMG